MSTLKVTTIQNLSGTEVYTAKAWVNFNGTGTVAIRASGNVSSITDNGTGDYTVSFITAMPTANYSAVYGANGGTTAYAGSYTQNTGTLRVFGSVAGSFNDIQICNVAVFC